MRFWKLAATCGISIASTASWGQAPREADPDRALKKLADHVGEDGIPSDLRSMIINKPRIAEETLQRTVGLREAKNPHIQRGEGLLLPDIKDNPAVSRVDLEALRQERIAMYEGKLNKLAPEAAGSEGTSPEAAVDAVAPAASGARPARSYFGLIVTGTLLAIGAAAGWLAWQRSRA